MQVSSLFASLRLANKDFRLANKDFRLTNKDFKLANKDFRLANKDFRIANKKIDLQLGGLILKSKTLCKDRYDQHTGCRGGLKEEKEEVFRQPAAAFFQFKVAETSQHLVFPNLCSSGLQTHFSFYQFLICKYHFLFASSKPICEINHGSLMLCLKIIILS